LTGRYKEAAVRLVVEKKQSVVGGAMGIRDQRHGIVSLETGVV